MGKSHNMQCPSFHTDDLHPAIMPNTTNESVVDRQSATYHASYVYAANRDNVPNIIRTLSMILIIVGIEIYIKRVSWRTVSKSYFLFYKI